MSTLQGGECLYERCWLQSATSDDRRRTTSWHFSLPPGHPWCGDKNCTALLNNMSSGDDVIVTHMAVWLVCPNTGPARDLGCRFDGRQLESRDPRGSPRMLRHAFV
jgi:hypothetical protein